jgi:hypothetical protein
VSVKSAAPTAAIPKAAAPFNLLVTRTSEKSRPRQILGSKRKVPRAALPLGRALPVAAINPVDVEGALGTI